VAQGCHLLYSASDRSDFDLRGIERQQAPPERETVLRSLGLIPDGRGPLLVGERGVAIDVPKAREYDIPDHVLEKARERWPGTSREWSGLSMALAGKPDMQAALLCGLGNETLSDEMAAALPDVLEGLHELRVSGLFDQARSRASIWVKTLHSTARGAADGSAYEVLAANRMRHRPARARSGGPELFVGTRDRLVFGPKIQARYGAEGPLRFVDHRGPGTFGQPDRTTVEADLLVVKPGGTEVAVDFKHWIQPVQLEEPQLEGVVVGLLTGEIDEFFFVANTSFRGESITAVEAANARIAAHNADPECLLKVAPIRLVEHYDWKP
jgi:hypothetical protein